MAAECIATTSCSALRTLFKTALGVWIHFLLVPWIAYPQFLTSNHDLNIKNVIFCSEIYVSGFDCIFLETLSYVPILTWGYLKAHSSAVNKIQDPWNRFSRFASEKLSIKFVKKHVENDDRFPSQWQLNASPPRRAVLYVHCFRLCLVPEYISCLSLESHPHNFSPQTMT